MRLTNILNKRGWLPEHKVEFQELLPLKLKQRVSGKGDKEETNACVQEIMNLLACMKKNDFNEQSCSKEVDGLDTCYKTHQMTKQQEKEQQRYGLLTPGVKKLNSRQMCILLKRFPSE